MLSFGGGQLFTAFFFPYDHHIAGLYKQAGAPNCAGIVTY